MFDLHACAQRIETDTWVQIPIACFTMLIAVVLCGLHLYWVALASFLIIACLIYLVVFTATQGKWLKPTNYSLLSFEQRKGILKRGIQYTIVAPTVLAASAKTLANTEAVIQALQHNSLASWSCYVNTPTQQLKVKTLTHLDAVAQDSSNGPLLVYCGGSLPTDNPMFSLMDETLIQANAHTSSRMDGVRLALHLDVTFPCVTFDWPTSSWDSINFGHKDDCWILNVVVKGIRRAFPFRKLIFIATQLGACRIFNWYHHKATMSTKQRIGQIVVYNPIFSHDHYIRSQATSESAKVWLSKVTRLLLRNYKPEDEQKYSFVLARSGRQQQQQHTVPILYLNTNTTEDKQELALLKQHFLYVSDLDVEAGVEGAEHSRRFRSYMLKRC